MTVDPAALARAAVGAAGGLLVDWTVEQLGDSGIMPTTESIERVRGMLDVEGTLRAFTLVAKTVRSLRFLPPFAALPQEVQALIEPMWRTEPEVYASGLHGALPPELRAPRLYALETLGEGRVRLWLEDVATASTTWDVQTYTAAAFALGRLAGRYPAAEIPWTFTRMPLDLERYLNTRIAGQTLPMLRDDRSWQHPLVRQSVDERLREDTLRLWERARRLLGRLDDLPQTLVHGDACPQNLLIEGRAGSARFIALDWGLPAPRPSAPISSSSIAGRVESGELDPREVPPIEHAILSAYRAGLAAEGVSENRERIERGYRTQLALRCGFTALPLERLQGARDDDPDLTLLFAQRARWARMVLDRVPESEAAPIRERANAHPPSASTRTPARRIAADLPSVSIGSLSRKTGSLAVSLARGGGPPARKGTMDILDEVLVGLLPPALGFAAGRLLTWAPWRFRARAARRSVAGARSPRLGHRCGRPRL